MPNLKIGDSKKIYCRSCKRVTNHEILNIAAFHDEAPGDIGVWVDITYFTLKCKGSDTVCLLREYIFSEDYDPETNDFLVERTVYPDPLSGREPLKDLSMLPKIIRLIYAESVNAFNKDLPMLASIGIRGTIEAICVDKAIDEGNLKKNINRLADMGFMTKQEAELLHLIRFMGNAAAHGLEVPLKEELVTGLDIIETALRNAYVLPKKAISLARYKKS